MQDKIRFLMDMIFYIVVLGIEVYVVDSSDQDVGISGESHLEGIA